MTKQQTTPSQKKIAEPLLLQARLRILYHKQNRFCPFLILAPPILIQIEIGRTFILLHIMF